jgi:hypothetical protein
MLTCMRTTNGTSPRMRLTTNPDETHPLAEWVSWYLDDEGYPRQDRSGRVIYTMRSTKDDRRLFGETPEEVAELAGSDPGRATSFSFIASTSADNAAIDSDEYGAMFAGLTMAEREKLEFGCWKPTSTLGGMLSSDKWRTVTKPVASITTRIRAWDFGASRPRPDYRDPDYTFAPLVLWDAHGRWYVTEPVAWREEPDDTERLFEETVLADGLHVIQALEIEPGAGGKSFAHSMARRIRAVYCSCAHRGDQACRCPRPRIVTFTAKAAARGASSRKISGMKASDPKVGKVKPVARELRLGMRGDVPRDRDRPPDDPVPWSPRGMILIDPNDDWTLRPYSDNGDHPATLGALWRAGTHRFPNDKHDDPADSLGIAHAAKRMLDAPVPPTRRGLYVVGGKRRR